eukprot:jgi/Mesvir1/6154/Mv00852-RA.1
MAPPKDDGTPKEEESGSKSGILSRIPRKSRSFQGKPEDNPDDMPRSPSHGAAADRNDDSEWLAEMVRGARNAARSIQLFKASFERITRELRLVPDLLVDIRAHLAEKHGKGREGREGREGRDSERGRKLSRSRSNSRSKDGRSRSASRESQKPSFIRKMFGLGPSRNVDVGLGDEVQPDGEDHEADLSTLLFEIEDCLVSMRTFTLSVSELSPLRLLFRGRGLLEDLEQEAIRIRTKIERLWTLRAQKAFDLSETQLELLRLLSTKGFRIDPSRDPEDLALLTQVAECPPNSSARAKEVLRLAIEHFRVDREALMAEVASIQHEFEELMAQHQPREGSARMKQMRALRKALHFLALAGVIELDEAAAAAAAAAHGGHSGGSSGRSADDSGRQGMQRNGSLSSSGGDFSGAMGRGSSGESPQQSPSRAHGLSGGGGSTKGNLRRNDSTPSSGTHTGSSVMMEEREEFPGLGLLPSMWAEMWSRKSGQVDESILSAVQLMRSTNSHEFRYGVTRMLDACKKEMDEGRGVDTVVSYIACGGMHALANALQDHADTLVLRTVVEGIHTMMQWGVKVDRNTPAVLANFLALRDGIRPLVALLRDGDSTGTRIAAARLLGALAHVHRVVRATVRSTVGLVPGLIALGLMDGKGLAEAIATLGTLSGEMAGNVGPGGPGTSRSSTSSQPGIVGLVPALIGFLKVAETAHSRVETMEEINRLLDRGFGAVAAAISQVGGVQVLMSIFREQLLAPVTSTGRAAVLEAIVEVITRMVELDQRTKTKISASVEHGGWVSNLLELMLEPDLSMRCMAAVSSLLAVLAHKNESVKQCILFGAGGGLGGGGGGLGKDLFMETVKEGVEGPIRPGLMKCLVDLIGKAHLSGNVGTRIGTNAIRLIRNLSLSEAGMRREKMVAAFSAAGCVEALILVLTDGNGSVVPGELKGLAAVALETFMRNPGDVEACVAVGGIPACMSVIIQASKASGSQEDVTWGNGARRKGGRGWNKAEAGGLHLLERGGRLGGCGLRFEVEAVAACCSARGGTCTARGERALGNAPAWRAGWGRGGRRARELIGMTYPSARNTHPWDGSTRLPWSWKGGAVRASGKVFHGPAGVVGRAGSSGGESQRRPDGALRGGVGWGPWPD